MNIDIIFSNIHIFLAEHTVLSPFIYLMSHIFFAVFLIPCAPMTVIAGALWGKWLGLGISVLSAFLSSCTTFWLSRRFLRTKIHTFLLKKYSKTDWFLEQSKKHGWKFVAMVQFNPAAPGSALGYLFGLSRISFPVYAFFAILFMLPLQIILVLFGDSFSSLFAGKIQWVLVAVALLAVLYACYKLRSYRLKNESNS